MWYCLLWFGLGFMLWYYLAQFCVIFWSLVENVFVVWICVAFCSCLALFNVVCSDMELLRQVGIVGLFGMMSGLVWYIMLWSSRIVFEMKWNLSLEILKMWIVYYTWTARQQEKYMYQDEKGLETKRKETNERERWIDIFNSADEICRQLDKSLKWHVNSSFCLLFVFFIVCFSVLCCLIRWFLWYLGSLWVVYLVQILFCVMLFSLVW